MLSPGLVLLGALAAAPRAADAPVKVAVPSPAAQEGPAPCVRKTAEGWEEPADLDALLACQARFRGDWVRAAARARGKQPAHSTIDAMDSYQRKEVREFLARHPERATTSASPGETPAEAAAPRARTPSKSSRCRPTGEPAQPGELAEPLQALNADLQESSSQGRAGITPQGAASIVDFLRCQQGGVSPEMDALLRLLVRDGAELKPDSMLELKRAARKAKGAGLELGVAQEMERWLLDPGTDPEAQPAGPRIN